MWNAGVPYILKQLIDVISQPGMIFGVDPETGYSHLLADRGKKAAVIYTSAVWGPPLGAEFGRTSNRPTSTTGCGGQESPTSPRSDTTQR